MKITPFEEGAILSEQFRRFTAVRTSLENAVKISKGVLREFAAAEVTPCRISTAKQAIDFICPVVSWASRFLFMEHGQWAYIVNNCYQGPPERDAYFICRRGKCRTVAVSALESDRQMHFHLPGRGKRSILSLDDAGAWYFMGMGSPMKFEHPRERRHKRRKDRLKLEVLKDYYEAFTRHPLPDWYALAKGRVRAFSVVYTKAEESTLVKPTLMDMTGERFVW